MTTLLKKAFSKLDRLPREEQDRHAKTILSNLEKETESAKKPVPLREIIGSAKGMGFKTPEEADRYLEAERDSWDS